MNLREAAQQALEALSEYEKSYPAVADAFKPLRAALNQERYVVTGNEFHGAPPEHYANWGDAIAAMIDRGVIQGLRISALAEDRSADAGKTSDHFADANKMVETSQESRQVEPVAWMLEEHGEWSVRKTIPPREEVSWREKLELPAWVPLYATPPKREPLTESFLEKLAEKHVTHCYFDTLTYAREIERLHGVGGKE